MLTSMGNVSCGCRHTLQAEALQRSKGLCSQGIADMILGQFALFAVICQISFFFLQVRTNKMHDLDSQENFRPIFYGTSRLTRVL